MTVSSSCLKSITATCSERIEHHYLQKTLTTSAYPKLVAVSLSIGCIFVSTIEILIRSIAIAPTGVYSLFHKFTTKEEAKIDVFKDNIEGILESIILPLISLFSVLKHNTLTAK